MDNRIRKMGVSCNNWSIGTPVYGVEYADDTVVMGITSSQLQEFLNLIQVEEPLYGTQLNKDKTQLLSPSNHTAIALQVTECTTVKTTQSIGYLGTEVSWVGTTKTAIRAKKAKAHAAYARIQHVWRSDLCVKAKPEHHNVFSPCSGLERQDYVHHPAPYWYDIVSKQTNCCFKFTPRRQNLQDNDFHWYLQAVPMRHVEIFQYFRGGKGSAWLSYKNLTCTYFYIPLINAMQKKLKCTKEAGEEHSAFAAHQHLGRTQVRAG